MFVFLETALKEKKKWAQGTEGGKRSRYRRRRKSVRGLEVEGIEEWAQKKE